MKRQDRLDEAIDTVAARLTNVTEDEGLALRIVQALPERSAWLPLGWIARFAGAALATLVIAVVLRTFDDGSTKVLRTQSLPAVSPAIVEPSQIARRTIVEPLLNVRRTRVDVHRTTGEAASGDHEFSLVAIAAPDALSLNLLAPSELTSEPPLEVESLVIADLPLGGESSPR
jgi:hypothetical protein